MRHVLITGASRGIGAAIAEHLARDPNVVLSLAARTVTQLQEVSAKIGRERTLPIALDLQNDESIVQAIQTAQAKFGPIHALICNAGTNAETPFSDTSAQNLQRFRDVLQTNLVGTTWLAQHACAQMPTGGRVVFIGSVLGRFGAPGTLAYTASKHALLGVVRTMAHELSPRKIAVNAINPDWVDTDMARDSLKRMADHAGMSLADMTRRQMDQLPVRRMVQPQEIALYIEFLLSPAGEVITGQGIDMSSGSVMN